MVLASINGIPDLHAGAATVLGGDVFRSRLDALVGFRGTDFYALDDFLALFAVLLAYAAWSPGAAILFPNMLPIL
jgi:hypothetical protein